MNDALKLITILAPAYSGSTLFALALGRNTEMLCLGEVKNHEKDYKPTTRCTCGKRLEVCSFWSEVRNKVNEQNPSLPQQEQMILESSSSHHPIDRAGGLYKIPILLGLPLNWVFGEQTVSSYQNKNKNYLNLIWEHAGRPDYLIDVSKPAERIDLMRKLEGVDTYCIYLKRNALQVYASTIKRPKKSRARFGFRRLREAIWFNLRRIHERRVYKRFADDKRMVVNFEAFAHDPDSVLKRICNQLGIEYTAQGRLINIQEQHLFVGNRWLFKEDLKSVKIREHMENKRLSPLDRIVFNGVSLLFGNRISS